MPSTIWEAPETLATLRLSRNGISFPLFGTFGLVLGKDISHLVAGTLGSPQHFLHGLFVDLCLHKAIKVDNGVSGSLERQAGDWF